jgi:hypothetical protein
MWSRLLALALLLLPAQALAGAKDKVAALAPSGLVLVMDAEGKELIAQNADQPFVPASVTKIVTAWLAMEVLGGDYRFETRFYLDHDRVLYVRGGGDPFLVSEELAKLAPELAAAIGKEPLTGIVLDASYYPSDLRIPGIEDTDEAYDALNSALAVNFNTIYAVRKGNRVRSAEKQTPITPLAISQFRARGPEGSGRISLAQDPAVSLKYAGELIAAFIDRAGGSVKGEISTGSVPRGLEPVYVHRQSPTLSEILAALLLASNNYIAQPGLPGDRRASPGWARQPREVPQGGEHARRARPRRFNPSRGGLGHQPRQPLHGPRPCPVAAPLRAPCHPAPPRRRRSLQDRHLFRRPHLGGLCRHLQAWASALRDRAHKQRRRDALPAAQSHPVRAVASMRARRAEASHLVAPIYRKRRNVPELKKLTAAEARDPIGSS